MADGTRQTIYAGDTSDAWEIGLVTSAPGVTPRVLAALDVNFTSRLRVAGAAPAIDRPVTIKNAANTRFIAWLTAEESLALGKGTWNIGLELRNLTLVPPLVREIHVVVRIEDALIPPP